MTYEHVPILGKYHDSGEGLLVPMLLGQSRYRLIYSVDANVGKREGLTLDRSHSGHNWMWSLSDYSQKKNTKKNLFFKRGSNTM